MNWFLIALIGPILNAVANHTDKYLITKYLKGGAVGSLIIFSSIFSVVALPIVLFFHPSVFNVSLIHGIVLAINGMLVVLAILCYFYALQKDEASYVVPFYQTIPIFGFILGYFILGETISTIQIIASLVIIFGATILSFEIGGEKIRFKKEVVLLMITASILFAVNGAIFKLIALDNGFWLSTFWSLIGKIILGVIFFVFIKSYRFQFMEMIKENKIAVLGLNSLSETLFIVAESVTQYAILLAPLVLVLLVSSFQPLFVFVIGVALTIFFPNISQESISKKNILQKIIGIGLIIIGTYFIGI
ncbi:MAG: EamA family transporter [Candidatus Paceibacterota bacterium]|jgi:drug/metabolite transporter (DMT)-like permease